jgi:hypothetical protein
MGVSVEYMLDQEEAEGLKRYFKDLGKKVELVWMSPEEFLAKVPHPITTTIPALLDLREEFFSKTSLNYIRKQIMKKEKLPPLLLDYSRMWFGWPTHEGRHRAFVAKTLGIEKVPVLIVGEEESKAKKGSITHKSLGELKGMEEGSEGKVIGRWGAARNWGGELTLSQIDATIHDVQRYIEDEKKVERIYYAESQNPVIKAINASDLLLEISKEEKTHAQELEALLPKLKEKWEEAQRKLI